MFSAQLTGGEVLSLGLTANERFKRSFGSWLWVGVMAATALHFALLNYFPAIRAADVSFGVREIAALDLPPEIEVPPAPEVIARPAVPVVAQTQLFEDVTIAPTTFEQNPIENLPPPPSEPAARLEAGPTFTPFTVAPRLRDRERAERIVRDKYPELLQQAGIGGTVVVWALIDERGVVQKCQVHTSCGVAALDEAALAATIEFSFVPALNYDRHVPVWISVPITFSVRPSS